MNKIKIHQVFNLNGQIINTLANFVLCDFLRLLFQRYIQGSFHVALMALCYFQITHLQWNLQTNARINYLFFALHFWPTMGSST